MNIAPTLRPRVSFIPIIVNALANQQNDASAKKFAAALDNVADPIVKGWERLSGPERAKRFNIGRSWQPPQGDLAAQLAAAATAWKNERAQIVQGRKKLIKAELDRALSMGLASYTPPPAFTRDKALAYEFQKSLYGKLFGCRCESADTATPPAKAAKYGVKVTKVKCHDQREVGNDEVYLVGAAVDGNGQIVSTISNKMSIDDGDGDVLYPNYWVYPMQDPNGFLDLGISMWEDDGGYAEAGRAVAAIGSAIATLPNPYTIGAGVALAIIGEALLLFSWFDNDDFYGSATRTWGSAASLAAGVGSYVMGYYEVDEGWLDDGHDFDVTINMLAA